MEGVHNMQEEERVRLIARQQGITDNDSDEDAGWKSWLGERLENKRTHRIILFLIAVDAICVLTDLSYTFLTPVHCPTNAELVPVEPTEGNPQWLEYLSYVSLAITLLFLLEIPLDLYAFGPRYFGLSRKRRNFPHAGLHLFDALIVVGTAVFEIGLRGREREVAGLLILLRLWRLIKLAGGVAVGVGSYDEEAVRLLREKEARIVQLEEEIETLKGTQRRAEL